MKEKQPKMPIATKSNLESRFDDILKQTNKSIRHKELAKAREGYLSLYSLYKTIIASSLPAKVKTDYHRKLLTLYSKLSWSIKR